MSKKSSQKLVQSLPQTWPKRLLANIVAEAKNKKRARIRRKISTLIMRGLGALAEGWWKIYSDTTHKNRQIVAVCSRSKGHALFCKQQMRTHSPPIFNNYALVLKQQQHNEWPVFLLKHPLNEQIIGTTRLLKPKTKGQFENLSQTA